MLGISPAIGLLFFFCYFSYGVWYLFREQINPKVFRRIYSYVLGETFLTIGVGYSAYWYLVKPLAAKSWWLGLPVHIITFLPFLSGIILLVLYPFPNESESTKGVIARFIARTLPWTILTLITWCFTGSWSFIDYRNAR